MPLSGDAIIDVVQVMSLFAAGAVFVGTVRKQYDALFTQDCARCRGTGMIICAQCRGTKTLRRRPGEFYKSAVGVRDRDGLDVYPCQYCGPMAPNDVPVPYGEEVVDDEERSLEIWDNVKDAMAGRRVRLPSPKFAGTQQCPECNGVAIMQRHTPNWPQFSGQRDNFQEECLLKKGRYKAMTGGSILRPYDHLEYPTLEPWNRELDPEAVVRDDEFAAGVVDFIKQTKQEYERETGNEAPEERPYEALRFVDDSDTDDDR